MNIEKEQDVLEKYGRDITASVKDDKVDPVIGRDEEIASITRILSRKTKNNPVLIGEPGVGKTAIVEGLAQRIVKGDVPDSLKNKIVWELDMGSLVAGAKYRREFEERLTKILKRVKESEGKIIMFIDEIHRLNRSVEEVLYSAMEDYALDIIIGKGPSARSIRLDLAKFTLIGATTRAGSLSAPLRDRFGVLSKFTLYETDDLKKIIHRSAGILGVDVDETSLEEMAKRSRGTPRVANRILKRVRDFSQVKGDGSITPEITQQALAALGVDEYGLEALDRELLETIITRFNGGPVGIDTIAASIGEERVTIEDVYEPYLIQAGFLHRTQKGRVVSEQAYRHLGIAVPESIEY